MRIAVDCRTLQESQPSGVSWYTFRQLIALIEASPEHEFELCVLKDHDLIQAPLYKRARAQLAYDRVHWRVLPYRKRWITLLTFFGILRSWRTVFGDCDVLWLPNLHFVPRTQAPFPLVQTVHDVSYKRYPQYLPIKGRLWHRHMRSLICAADALVCVSQSTVSELQRYYVVDPKVCTVIFPGVDVIARGNAHERSSVPHVLCISTIEPRKNIDTLIDACALVRKSMPGLVCTVVGKPGFRSRRTLQRMNQSGIRYYGYVSEEEKERLYSEASLMVYPSIYEGFGLPPLEAQAHGIPVIAGNNTSLPEVLGDSAVLCDVNDTKALATSILALIQEPGYADVLRYRGMHNVERFSWAHSANQLKKVLESMHDRIQSRRNYSA